MAMLDSAHMEMDVTVKLSEKPEDEIMFTRMEYDGQFDGDQQLLSTNDFSGAVETGAVRMVDGKAYIRDSSAGEWKIADEDEARGFNGTFDAIRELINRDWAGARPENADNGGGHLERPTGVSHHG